MAALALLAVNDHLLKAAFPGLLTGKLSDVAALIVVPPIVVELARLAAGPLWSPAARRRTAIAAGILVAGLLATVKVDPVANAWYATLLGLVQWPVTTVVAVLEGTSIGGPLAAPTIIDPGDLAALPAAALGTWVAAGGLPDRWAVEWALRPFARAGLLAGAVFILAATSQSPPTSVTAIERDELLLAPGDPPVHRHLVATVSVSARSSSTGSPDPVLTSIEARARWPRVEPPARFVITRLTADGGVEPGTGSGPVLHLAPDECSRGCVIDLDVAIDWPDAAGRPPSSIAWELAVTSRASSGYVQGGISIEGDETGTTAAGSTGVLVAVLGLLPFVGVMVGGQMRRPAAKHGVTSGLDRITAGSTLLLVVGLALVPVVVPSRAFEPAAGGVGTFAWAGSPLLAAALVGGLVRWWSGRGDVLAATVLGGGLIALLFGARLVGEASQSFIVTGLQLAVAGSVLASVSIAGALTRPDMPEATDLDAPSEPFGAGRIAVAGVLVALALGLLGTVFPVGVLLGFALVVWWAGRGVMLGLTTFFLAGGLCAVLVLGGPVLFGPRWTDFELATILLGLLASGVGFVAALGGLAPHPGRATAHQTVVGPGPDDVARSAD